LAPGVFPLPKTRAGTNSGAPNAAPAANTPADCKKSRREMIRFGLIFSKLIWGDINIKKRNQSVWKG
jgi:hypothetical protein